MIKFLIGYKSITLILTLLLANYTFSQNFKDGVNKISVQLESVEASKVQFSQSIKDISSGYVVFTLTELDAKGNTETINYEFSFADVDINTVRTITKKEVILVQLLVKGKQKLIKKTEISSDKISFTNELFLYAKNIDNGRVLVEEIKEIIPLNETIEKNKLALKNYNEHLQWLVNNVVEVDFSKKQYAQKLSHDSKQNGFAKLETTMSAKSKSQNFSYEFNFAVLNPNSINIKIKSDEFYIEVENRRSIKTIKAFENNVQKSFTNNIRFYASSLENGKDIYKVLKAIIPLAEDAFLKSKPNIETRTNAIDYLNKVAANISTADKAISQTIENGCVTEFNLKMSTSKVDDDHVYTFNFIDVNNDNIDFNSQKDLLFVGLGIKQRNKYIRHLKNGELQNYKESLRLYVNSVEEAMLVKEAIQNIIKDCKASVKNVGKLSEGQGVQKLSEIIGIVKVNDNSYEQSIELIDKESNVIKLTQIFSNLKKSEEIIYEFGLKDINPKSIIMKTSGRNVLVEMSTKYFEKIIKTYEDGEIKSYANKIVLQASSIENGREIISLFKIITED